MAAKRLDRVPPSPSLARKKPARIAKPKIIVYCEGATEEHYLNKIRSELGSRMVEIEALGQIGVPDTVVQKAVDRLAELTTAARRRTSDSFDSLFTVWAMFDKDDFEVDAAKQAAGNAGVRVAFSNPCFELWGVLHLEDCDAPNDRHATQRRLKEIMPPYDHEANPYFNYDLMTEAARSDALRRARILKRRREDEQSPEDSPFTSVCDLVEQILVATGNLQSVEEAISDVKLEIAALTSREDAYTNATQANLSRLYDTLKQLKA